MAYKSRVSDAVVRRLPMYYRHLKELEKAGVVRIPTGDYGWNAASMGGNTDCAMKVSADGVYMYIYVLHPNANLGCIRVDCLDK